MQIDKDLPPLPPAYITSPPGEAAVPRPGPWPPGYPSPTPEVKDR